MSNRILSDAFQNLGSGAELLQLSPEEKKAIKEWIERTVKKSDSRQAVSSEVKKWNDLMSSDG